MNASTQKILPSTSTSTSIDTNITDTKTSNNVNAPTSTSTSTCTTSSRIQRLSNELTPYRNRHIQFMVHCLHSLPYHYATLDTNRLTLVHFAVQSLDILGFFDDNDNDNDDSNSNCRKYNVNKEEIINWIYSLQVVHEVDDHSNNDVDVDDNAGGGNSMYTCTDHTNTNTSTDTSYRNNERKTRVRKRTTVRGGFMGGSFLGPTNNSNNNHNNNHNHYQYHIAMTYTALCTLITLGDDLSRVNYDAILNGLADLQMDDGSFQSIASFPSASGSNINSQSRTKNATRTHGNIKPQTQSSETDLRFLYCACAICHILNIHRSTCSTNTNTNTNINTNTNTNNRSNLGWSTISKHEAVEYIQACKSFDGALGLVPGMEGHGGSTFCGVASLILMDMDADNGDCGDDCDADRRNNVGFLERVFPTSSTCTGTGREELMQWCASRQMEGMQGRPNKLEDTCYSYWIGGTLYMLMALDDMCMDDASAAPFGHVPSSECGGSNNSDDIDFDTKFILDQDKLQDFIIDCQTEMGGFSKLRNHGSGGGSGSPPPDLLHSFYSLAWLSLSSNLDLNANAAPSSEGFVPLNPIDCVLGMSQRRIDSFRKKVLIRRETNE